MIPKAGIEGDSANGVPVQQQPDGGAFELYRPSADGPLHLPSGEYAFTLESVGPEPLPLAPAYRDPTRSPLRRTWTEDESALELILPSR